MEKIKSFMVALFADILIQQNSWTIFDSSAAIAPKQANKDDCGVFLIMYAYCLRSVYLFVVYDLIRPQGIEKLLPIILLQVRQI